MTDVIKTSQRLTLALALMLLLASCSTARAYHAGAHEGYRQAMRLCPCKVKEACTSESDKAP